MCIYRSPSGDFDQFSNLCDLTLKYLHNLNMEFVICGDFNINFSKVYIFKKNKKKKKPYSFKLQSINFPTRIGKVFSSAFDNILMSMVELTHITHLL
jgi:hypothetical protein